MRIRKVAALALWTAATAFVLVLPSLGQERIGVDMRDVPPGYGPRRGRGWGPEQATGEPDTLQAGDISTAWASRHPDAGPEWLKLEYDKEADIGEVRIRETHNPGAITKVTAFDKDGKEEVLWQGREPDHDFPGDFVVPVAKDRNVLTKSVKIYLDTTLVQGWNEIDAVRLVAKDGTGQWAARATASSTFAELGGGMDVPPPPPPPVDRFNRGDPFNELGEGPVKVKLQGNEVIEGVFVRSRGEFIIIRQPAAKKLLIISKQQIVLVEAPDAERERDGHAGPPPPQPPRGRFGPGDPFNELAEGPVKVKLVGNEVIEGVFVRSRGDFIILKQPAANKLALINRQQIVLVEAPEP
jgi:hypothetical protein